MSTYADVKAILDEMWTTMQNASGSHDPSPGETWFRCRFGESIEAALDDPDDPADWSKDKDIVLQMVALSAGLAVLDSEMTRRGNKTHPLLRDDIKAAFIKVKNAACPEKGRWCNFIGGPWIGV